MKRIKMIFVTTLLMLVMVSGTAFAVSKNEKDTVKYSSYIKEYTGASSSCTIVGGDEDVYTLINNTASDSRYLTTSAWEYAYNIGWTSKDSDSDVVDYGYQVNSEIYRNKSIVGYYYHAAHCYLNSYTYQICDSYIYKAIQSEE